MRLERLGAARLLVADAAGDLGVDSGCPLTHRTQGQLEGRP